MDFTNSSASAGFIQGARSSMHDKISHHADSSIARRWWAKISRSSWPASSFGSSSPPYRSLKSLAQLFQSEARHRRPTAPRPGHRELPLARLATNRALTASFVLGVPPEDRSVRHDRIEAASYVAEECASVIQGAVQGVAAGCLSFLPGDGHVSAVARACPYWSGSSAFLAFRHFRFPQ